MSKGILWEIGGKTRTLRFTLNALRDAEKALGKSAITFFADPALLLASIDAQVTLAWAGLRHEDMTLTLEGAGDLLQAALEGGATIGDIAEKLAQAVAECRLFGKPKEGDAPADPPTAAPAA